MFGNKLGKITSGINHLEEERFRRNDILIYQLATTNKQACLRFSSKGKKAGFGLKNSIGATCRTPVPVNQPKQTHDDPESFIATI